MRWPCAILLLSLLLSSAPAHADGPLAAMQAGEHPAAGSDEDELWYAMDQFEKQVRESPQLVRDPALNAYIHDVACRVAADYCRDLRVYVLDVPWFNASMAPNGMLVVWTGALLRMRDEADLALVLGHEFGHYRERHTLQQWRKLKRSSAFLSAFGVLSAGAGVGIAGVAADFAGAASLSKFSRDKEREADRIGFERLQALGYDPKSGVQLWDRMLREEQARDYGKPIPAFASHPQTRERRDDLAAAAAALPNPGSELGRERYLAATRPFLRHWLDGELARRMYATSVQVIGDLRVLAPADERGLYTYYLGEAHRRRGKADDAAQADALFADAVTEPGAPAEAWRALGLAARDAGHRAEATTALRRYLALAPDADDRAFIVADLQQLEAAP